MERRFEVMWIFSLKVTQIGDKAENRPSILVPERPKRRPTHPVPKFGGGRVKSFL